MCPKVRDGWCHFVSPYSPAGRGLPGKELHAGQISHQGKNLVAGLVRLFAVGFNRGNDELMNVGSLPLWMSLGCQQADPNEDFYVMNGNRALIKREKFERYLDQATAV